LKNVFEAADTRQKQAKKRSLCVINKHFEPVFNTVAATQIVFQRPAKPDGTPRKLMDVTRLKNMGWYAKIGLREGLEDTYRWYQSSMVRSV
jgi:nucleoside-diphosphate-sugar epimerase